jgi:uncharacterized MAPEG superfamily protein
MSEPANLALPSIAAAWALNLVPHGYYFVKMMSASNGTATNVMPRTNLDTLKTRIPAATWGALARARGAHLNAIEGFPLFAACMVRSPKGRGGGRVRQKLFFLQSTLLLTTDGRV